LDEDQRGRGKSCDEGTMRAYVQQYGDKYWKWRITTDNGKGIAQSHYTYDYPKEAKDALIRFMQTMKTLDGITLIVRGFVFEDELEIPLKTSLSSKSLP
jgi:hypothetical protein